MAPRISTFILVCYIFVYLSMQINQILMPSRLGGGGRIPRLHLFRGVRPLSPMSVLVYDTKQSGGELPVMQELWRMRSLPSFPLLPGPLWPGMVAPDRILSEGQIERNLVLMLNWIVWNGTVFDIETVLTLNWI